jgi:hypothetical protein
MAAALAAPLVSRDSALFLTAVEQYLRHAPVPFADRCAACGAWLPGAATGTRRHYRGRGGPDEL